MDFHGCVNSIIYADIFFLSTDLHKIQVLVVVDEGEGGRGVETEPDLVH